MKKTHYILILVLIISSVLVFLFCKTDAKLKGTWIGEYSINSDNSEMKVVFAEQNLFTFKNRRSFAKGSKYTYGTEIRKSNYMLFSGIIIFDEGIDYAEYEQYEILKVENDSLVIKSPSGTFLHIYRKLSDTLKHKQKIKLVSKKFFWKNRMFQDTIYFKTDSTLVRKSNKRPNYDTSSWERISYEGFDILFMDGDVPYLIVNQNGKTINLRTFHKTDIEHTMTKLE